VEVYHSLARLSYGNKVHLKLARWCQQLFALIFLCIVSICITITLSDCNRNHPSIVLRILLVAEIENSFPESFAVHTVGGKTINFVPEKRFSCVWRLSSNQPTSSSVLAPGFLLGLRGCACSPGLLRWGAKVWLFAALWKARVATSKTHCWQCCCKLLLSFHRDLKARTQIPSCGLNSSRGAGQVQCRAAAGGCPVHPRAVPNLSPWPGEHPMLVLAPPRNKVEPRDPIHSSNAATKMPFAHGWGGDPILYLTSNK